MTAISSHNAYAMRKSFSRGWSRYYKDESETEAKTETSDVEGSGGTNLRDFVALLPRTTSVSCTREEPQKLIRVVQSDSALKPGISGSLPDLITGDKGEGSNFGGMFFHHLIEVSKTGEYRILSLPLVNRTFPVGFP